jgi:hypothetical protein
MKMKKHRKTGMFFTIVLAVFSAMSVLAQTDTTTPVRSRQGGIDANGDGLCDITGRAIGSGAGSGQGQQARKNQSQQTGNGFGNSLKQPGAQRGNGVRTGNCTGIGRMNRAGRR